jgi:hypothetical protein
MNWYNSSTISLYDLDSYTTLIKIQEITMNIDFYLAFEY